jgi:hypothetical protein
LLQIFLFQTKERIHLHQFPQGLLSGLRVPVLKEKAKEIPLPVPDALSYSLKTGQE